MIKFICIAFLVNIKKTWDWNFMEKWNKQSDLTDGGIIPETDNLGREKFWEDLGRPNE
jgi:hypothetical protein